jgi:endogenous inhibitor of DNA gyrase (YacG/DUF329 family)
VPERACPICRKPVPPRAANPAFPFCSARCKLLDLGKWLGEEYRVAGPRAGDGAERPPREDDADR